MTPYEALYGQPPPYLVSYLLGTSKVDFVDSTLTHRQDIFKDLKDNLTISQNRMNQQADQHRSEYHFNMGDMDFLHHHPYKQTYLNLKDHQNIAPIFYGPYKILYNIGHVAYKLELPQTSKIHPIFHVSCIKRSVGTHTPIQTALSNLDEEGFILIQPVAIINQHSHQLHSRIITKVLIQWQGLQLEDATWEPLMNFQQQFVEFKL